MSRKLQRARIVLAVALPAILVSTPLTAADLGYGGRLADSSGAPLAGPVDIIVRFFGSETGTDQLGAPKSFPGVSLSNGVFQLTLGLDAAEQAAVFGDGSTPVFVEVEAGGIAYPRQRYTAVPLALRVPVDNDALVYGADARLTVGQISMSQVTGLASALASKLDQQQAITPSSTVEAGSVSTTAQSGLIIKPYGSLAGETGELRFETRGGGRFVGFKAPDSVAADRVWTLPAGDGAAGEVLTTDGQGTLSWGGLSGANLADGSITDADVSASAAITDTKLATITTAGKVSGAAITSGTIGGTATFGGSGGVSTTGAIAGSGHFSVNGTGSATTELRFGDTDNSHYIGLKAPATVSANQVWTLPAAEGGAGQFLMTNGAGALSWGSPAGGGDVMASANLSDLANVATARSNLGLGSLATLSAVSAGEITDGTIANADIAGTAGIATSKLSGAVTAITGHGLGSLAALSVVGSTEIANGTIVDDDISGTAAVATSKLSGAVTSISGHGLGALATLGSVSSAEITDATVVDADIADTAAIATSKLSGALTAVSGHGLGALATLGSVSSAEITDATVVDADIADTAAIATSKLSGAVTAIAGHGLGALAALSTVASTHITDGTIVDADIAGTAAISSTKISFADNGISGDKVDGGTISNFASTGIDDNASAITMTINAFGNVGIGTTTPVDVLHIYADSGVKALTLQSPGGAGNTPQIRFVDPTASQATTWVLRKRYTSADDFGIGPVGSAVFLMDAAGNAALGGTANSFAKSLYVGASGNVGIGTTAPGNPLTVQSSTQYMGLQVRNATNRVAELTGGSAVNEGGLLALYNNASQDVLIRASGTSWLNGGNVGIGTTGPTSKLHVTGSSATGELTVTTSSTSGSISTASLLAPSATGDTYYTVGRALSSGNAALIGHSTTGGGTYAFVTTYGRPASDFVVATTGNVGIGTTAPSAKLEVTGAIKQTSCPSGQTKIYDNFCIDSSDRSAAAMPTAQNACLQLGGHVCREDEIIAACNVLGGAAITVGLWLNETTGDDLYKYVNGQICSNLDGPGTDKAVARAYRCCYGVH